MPRNQEVIRQWKILETIEASRLGATIPALAEALAVTTRTIRRDLAALQEAGFPIYDDDGEGTKHWRLDPGKLTGLDRQGFTLAEACALYVSRSMLVTLAGTPFRDDVARAFDRVARGLPPAVRKFLDRLPSAVAFKGEPGPALETNEQPELMPRLLDATVQHRRVRMRYHSASSRRAKEYLVEPYRVVYGRGAWYLVAFVTEYREMRTFALARIEHLTVLEDCFTPVAEAGEVFANSLGIHQGPPVKVVLTFDARIAAYVRERRWHPSQVLRALPDGGLRLTLQVSDDWALRAWVLGFGSLVRVEAPASLAEHVLGEVEGVREHYLPAMPLEPLPPPATTRGQRRLPLASRARPRRAGRG